MPTIITSGSIAARAYGFSRRSWPYDGTVGIFSLGYTASVGANSTRNKYTYSTCASTATGIPNSSNTTYASAGVGNATRSIFALGYSPTSTPSTKREKYVYAYDTSTVSGIASSSANSTYGSAAGNSTRGIFALGLSTTNATSYSTTRNKYTYATDASTASGVGAASRVSGLGSAAGNSTRGIFALGGGLCGSTCVVTKVRNKYTYACCTSTATGVAQASLCSGEGSAAGNSTRGIFALGYQFTSIFNFGVTTTRNKYTYACCTSVAATAASIAGEASSAAGNSTRGIFALGCRSVGPAPKNNSVTTRDKYTYSTDASTSSGVGVASANTSHGSASSWAISVNCGL